MDKLQVVYKRVEDLIPYINNARTHSDEQVSQIAASIKEFGFNNPILLDGSNGVIAGHGRLLAAKKLGLAEAPCIELAGLSEAQKKAYILADNRIALNSGWDNEMLKTELEFLRGGAESLDFIEKLGFSEDEVEKIFDTGEMDSMPELDNLDSLEVHTMTMNVSTDDQETINAAIKQWKKENPDASSNSLGNSTGIAVAAICREWMQ